MGLLGMMCGERREWEWRVMSGSVERPLCLATCTLKPTLKQHQIPNQCTPSPPLPDCFSLVFYIHSEEVINIGGMSFTPKMRLLEVPDNENGLSHYAHVPALAP